MPCVIVVGTGRSGTSMVAGILHKLGVSMGDEFVSTPRTNPYGTFEDLQLFQMTRSILEGKVDPDKAYLSLILERSDRNDWWGFKDPALCNTLNHFTKHIAQPLVVVVRRGTEDTINSYMRAYNAGRKTAERWYYTVSRLLAQQLTEFEETCGEGKTLVIEFDEVVGDPSQTVAKLLDFVFAKDFDELDRCVTDAMIDEAVAHVHGDRYTASDVSTDFGTLAIGVRIAKYPEAGFFRDWTALMTGGLRSGDTVLAPVAHMPAHWASNQIARAFLRSGRDTLLMIDDDMSFPVKALETLRTDVRTFEYDAVMAFATHRTWPPKPVIMRYLGGVDAPHNLKGDNFDIVTDFDDGSIIEVDTLGLAFTLIRRPVFEAMVSEEFGLEYTYFFDYGYGVESDEISFFRRARSMGFRMAINTSIKIEHLGTWSFGWDDFQRWQREDGQVMSLDVQVEKGATADEVRAAIARSLQLDEGATEKEIQDVVADALQRCDRKV